MKISLLSLCFALAACAAPKGTLVHNDKLGNVSYRGGTGLVYSRSSASDAMYDKYNNSEMEAYADHQFGQLQGEIDRATAREKDSERLQQAIKNCDKKVDLAVAILKTQARLALEAGNINNYERLNKKAIDTETKLLKEQNACIDKATNAI